MSNFSELGWASQEEYDSALAEAGGVAVMYKTDYDDWKAVYGPEISTTAEWQDAFDGNIDTTDQVIKGNGSDNIFTGSTINEIDCSDQMNNVLFVDSGGVGGPYVENQIYYFVFDAGAGSAWKLSVLESITEPTWDYLQVWASSVGGAAATALPGDSATSHQIFETDGVTDIRETQNFLCNFTLADKSTPGVFHNQAVAGTGSNTIPSTLENSAVVLSRYRYLVFHFVSDYGGNRNGWKINLQRVLLGSPIPFRSFVAGFETDSHRASIENAIVVDGTTTTFNGPEGSNGFGRYTRFSADGTRVAVLHEESWGGQDATKAASKRGYLYTYHKTAGGDWKATGYIGPYLLSVTSDSSYSFSSRMDLSSDGLTLAFAHNATDAVKVYRLDQVRHRWLQIGEDISNFTECSLANGGNTLAVSNNFFGSSSAGKVEVYDFSGGNWVQRGQLILGENGYQLGAEVDLAGAEPANRMVVYSSRNGGGASQLGRFSNFYFRDGTWRQLGGHISEIFGAGDHYQYQAVMSDDGRIFAVACMQENHNGKSVLRVYHTKGHFQHQIGSDIELAAVPSGDSYGFGTSLALSGDGARLAIGQNSYSGGTESKVQVFQLSLDGSEYVPQQEVGGTKAQLLDIDLSADGRLLLIGSTEEGGADGGEGLVRIVDLDSSAPASADAQAAGFASTARMNLTRSVAGAFPAADVSYTECIQFLDAMVLTQEENTRVFGFDNAQAYVVANNRTGVFPTIKGVYDTWLDAETVRATAAVAPRFEFKVPDLYSQNDTVTVPEPNTGKYLFKDDGGDANYSSNKDYYVFFDSQIYPAATAVGWEVRFEDFASLPRSEGYADYLEMWVGDSPDESEEKVPFFDSTTGLDSGGNANVLAKYPDPSDPTNNGYPHSEIVLGGTTFFFEYTQENFDELFKDKVFQSEKRYLKFRFHSDGGTDYTGWKIELTKRNLSVPIPYSNTQYVADIVEDIKAAAQPDLPFFTPTTVEQAAAYQHALASAQDAATVSKANFVRGFASDEEASAVDNLAEGAVKTARLLAHKSAFYTGLVHPSADYTAYTLSIAAHALGFETTAAQATAVSDTGAPDVTADQYAAFGTAFGAAQTACAATGLQALTKEVFRAGFASAEDRAAADAHASSADVISLALGVFLAALAEGEADPDKWTLSPAAYDQGSYANDAAMVAAAIGIIGFPVSRAHAAAFFAAYRVATAADSYELTHAMFKAGYFSAEQYNYQTSKPPSPEKTAQTYIFGQQFNDTAVYSQPPSDDPADWTFSDAKLNTTGFGSYTEAFDAWQATGLSLSAGGLTKVSYEAAEAGFESTAAQATAVSYTGAPDVTASQYAAFEAAFAAAQLANENISKSLFREGFTSYDDYEGATVEDIANAKTKFLAALAAESGPDPSNWTLQTDPPPTSNELSTENENLGWTSDAQRTKAQTETGFLEVTATMWAILSRGGFATAADRTNAEAQIEPLKTVLLAAALANVTAARDRQETVESKWGVSLDSTSSGYPYDGAELVFEAGTERDSYTTAATTAHSAGFGSGATDYRAYFLSPAAHSAGFESDLDYATARTETGVDDVTAAMYSKFTSVLESLSVASGTTAAELREGVRSAGEKEIMSDAEKEAAQAVFLSALASPDLLPPGRWTRSSAQARAGGWPDDYVLDIGVPENHDIAHYTENSKFGGYLTQQPYRTVSQDAVGLADHIQNVLDQGYPPTSSALAEQLLAALNVGKLVVESSVAVENALASLTAIETAVGAIFTASTDHEFQALNGNSGRTAGGGEAPEPDGFRQKLTVRLAGIRNLVLLHDTDDDGKPDATDPFPNNATKWTYAQHANAKTVELDEMVLSSPLDSAQNVMAFWNKSNEIQDAANSSADAAEAEKDTALDQATNAESIMTAVASNFVGHSAAAFASLRRTVKESNPGIKNKRRLRDTSIVFPSLLFQNGTPEKSDLMASLLLMDNLLIPESRQIRTPGPPQTYSGLGLSSAHVTYDLQTSLLMSQVGSTSDAVLFPLAEGDTFTGMYNGAQVFSLVQGSHTLGGYGPGDVVANVNGYNIRLAGIGSTVLVSEPAPTASATGDPYVTDLQGRRTKLPSREQCYRLLEIPGHIMVNARVGRLSAGDAEQVHSRLGPLADAEGYFFRKFAVRTPSGTHIQLDDMLRAETPVQLAEGLELRPIQETQTYVCPEQGTIRYRGWLLCSPGLWGLELRLYDHPQVRNGVAVAFISGHLAQRSLGVLMGSGSRASRLRSRTRVNDFRPLAGLYLTAAGARNSQPNGRRRRRAREDRERTTRDLWVEVVTRS